jgi:hypothetical protein
MCIRSYHDFLENGEIVTITYANGKQEQRLLRRDQALLLDEAIKRYQKNSGKETKIDLKSFVIEEKSNIAELKQTVTVPEEPEYTQDPAVPPLFENPHVKQPDDKKKWRW